MLDEAGEICIYTPGGLTLFASSLDQVMAMVSLGPPCLRWVPTAELEW